MAHTYRRIKALILIVGIFGAARALAEANCIENIRAADKTIEVQGANVVSAMAANVAVTNCEQELSKIETKLFGSLAGTCADSFSNTSGAVVDASVAICKMNAARYVMSLQLQSQ